MTRSCGDCSSRISLHERFLAVESASRWRFGRLLLPGRGRFENTVDAPQPLARTERLWSDRQHVPVVVTDQNALGHGSGSFSGLLASRPTKEKKRRSGVPSSSQLPRCPTPASLPRMPVQPNYRLNRGHVKPGGWRNPSRGNQRICFTTLGYIALGLGIRIGC